MPGEGAGIRRCSAIANQESLGPPHSNPLPPGESGPAVRSFHLEPRKRIEPPSVLCQTVLPANHATLLCPGLPTGTLRPAAGLPVPHRRGRPWVEAAARSGDRVDAVMRRRRPRFRACRVGPGAMGSSSGLASAGRARLAQRKPVAAGGVMRHGAALDFCRICRVWRRVP